LAQQTLDEDLKAQDEVIKKTSSNNRNDASPKKMVHE